MEVRRKRKAAHPGELIREILLSETGKSQTELAKLMGVFRRTVSEIIHGFASAEVFI
jgi:plasmid maintenance system antidote protein VapI